MRTAGRTWHFNEGFSTASRAFARPAAIASLVGVVLLGLFLAIRRTSGAISSPLPPAQLIATAIVLLTWAFGAIATLLSSDARATWAIRLTTAAAVLLFAIACSYPGSRAINWLVWLPVIGATACAPEVFTYLRKTTGRPASPSASVREPRIDAAEESQNFGSVDDESHQLLQQLTRFRTADGGEVIQATLAVEFRPGHRSTTLYIAFCPPFEYLPEVEASIAEGPDAGVKVAQLLHNGARLDVQLSASHSVQQKVLVELLAAGTTKAINS